MKTLYFDMDGVVARYDYGLYVPKQKNEIPPFLILNSHVFRDLEPDDTILESLNILYSKYRDSEYVTVKILTNIPTGLLQAEHTIDKYEWCKKHIQGFKQEDFFCTSVKKHNAVAQTLWSLTEDDILIDDYNKNLDNWTAHGGHAVKYINGINSVNIKYDSILHTWTPEGIVRKLEFIMNL